MGEAIPPLFMDLWKNYKQVISDVFPDLVHEQDWCNWKGDLDLDARLYKGKYFIKAREAEIYNDTSSIYNTIMYPKTGKGLPCFGMDLMGFFEKKVIIVFDFQHPVENYLFSVGDLLPKAEGTFRFFEPGNHFSEHIYVAKCTMSQVDDHLESFANYLTVYRDMVESASPVEEDVQVYSDFDLYMRKLEPVSGYLTKAFGKEKSEKFVNEFLFTYG